MLQDLSMEVARWLQKQPAAGEESITDWFLYQLSERLPFTFYRKFTRFEESRETGADWEWWFLGRHGGIGARIQAKKLTPGQDHYRGLAHTARTGLQIELLRDAAAQRRLLALYVFYNAGPVSSTVRCGLDSRPAPEALFFSGAEEVYRRFIKDGRKKVSVEAILEISTPLPCFSCCPLVQDQQDPLQGVRAFLHHYHPLAIAPSAADPALAASGASFGFFESVPDYVTAFARASSETLPDSWENEFSESIRDTKALLVVDLRNSG